MKTYVPDRSDTRGFKTSPSVKPVVVTKPVSQRTSVIRWFTWERLILGSLLLGSLMLNGRLNSQFRAARFSSKLFYDGMTEQVEIRDQLYKEIKVLKEELRKAQSEKANSNAAGKESQQKLEEAEGKLNQAEMELKRKADERNDLSLRHFQGLLDTAEVVHGDPSLSRSFLSDAISFAKDHQLDYATPERLLSNLSVKHGNLASCHVEVLSVRRDPLGIVVDLAVTDAGGLPLKGLERADFEVRSGERRVHMAAVGAAHLSDQQHETVVLLDMSGSTKGAPHDAAIEGASAFLMSGSVQSKFRVYQFADDVLPVTPWSNDGGLHRAAVERLTSGGGTALYKAIRIAMEDLLTRSGSRSIVVFTDGSDSFNTEDPDATLRHCKDKGIQIHVLALMTSEVKESVLQSIAEETGGMYLSTPDPSHLVEQFDQIASAFKRPVYRLAIFEPVDERSLTVQVGDLLPVALTVADGIKPTKSGS